jgi:hypothetical protein
MQHLGKQDGLGAECQSSLLRELRLNHFELSGEVDQWFLRNKYAPFSILA